MFQVQIWIEANDRVLDLSDALILLKLVIPAQVFL